MRSACIERKTKETEITLSLCLDGTGTADIQSGVGFLDHMLTLLASRSGFDLELSCAGDSYVDDHHSVEDIGIAFGEAFSQALGDKTGIARYGDVDLPMDEALVLSAVDLCGRCTLVYDVEGLPEKVGTFDCQLAEEFWQAFARSAGAAVHIHKICGKNAHHILEAEYKGMGVALGRAVTVVGGGVPSTKGVL